MEGRASDYFVVQFYLILGLSFFLFILYSLSYIQSKIKIQPRRLNYYRFLAMLLHASIKQCF